MATTYSRVAVAIIGLILVGCSTWSSATGIASESPASPGASPQSAEPASAAPTASSEPNRPGGLVYVVEATAALHVYTMPASGAEEPQALPIEGELLRWSQDGQQLSVVGPSPQGLVFVGLMNRHGTDYVQFDSPDPTLNLGCSAWSPDGRWFACEGWDDADPGRDGMYTVRASDGAGLTRITTAPEGTHDFPCDYSPDGSRIAFIRIDLADEAHSTLMVMNADGTGAQQLTPQPVGLACRWSPDGSLILTEAEGELFVVPTSGGEPAPIRLEVASGANASRASWSPDGTQIAFSLSSSGDPFDLFVADADGSNVTRLTETSDEHEELGDWGLLP